MNEKYLFQHLPADSNRMRFGIAFLAAGIVLMLWAWGSWIFRATGTTEGASSILSLDSSDDSLPGNTANLDQAEVAKTLPVFLMYGFILVIIFLVFSYLIVRTTRRYRAGISRKRAPPTDSEDVWSMHKIPKDDDYAR